MMILINAFKSISRAKGRNILIGIIIFVIAASSCISLAIKNSASEAETSGLASKTITASISVDRQKIMENAQSSAGTSENGRPDMEKMREVMQQYPSLTLEQLKEYASSDYIKEFYYSESISLNANSDIEAYSESSTSSESSNNNMPNGQMGPGGQVINSRGGEMSIGDFTITGYSSESAMTKFIEGSSKVTDGEMFDINSSDLTCLISSELASFNGLKTGDTITLLNPNNETETYTFTISGIYTNTDTSESSGMMRFSTSQDPSNLICISDNALQSIISASEKSEVTVQNTNGSETSSKITSQLSGTYVFSSKENYDAFNAELKSKGLSEYYVLSSSDVTNYEASLVPLKNLNNFATTLLVIILGVGAIILIVLNIFNIRERKYEVGVLTAIGIKKWKVATQFVTELLVVALLAIILGAGIGSIASVPISNSLLQSQVESEEEAASSQEQNFGRMGPSVQVGTPGQITSNSPSATEYIDTINATVNFKILSQLFGLGIILTVLSSLVGIIFVLRYEPLKILANRS